MICNEVKNLCYINSSYNQLGDKLPKSVLEGKEGIQEPMENIQTNYGFLTSLITKSQVFGVLGLA